MLGSGVGSWVREGMMSPRPQHCSMRPAAFDLAHPANCTEPVLPCAHELR